MSKSKKQLTEYMIPVRVTYTATVFVRAASEDQAVTQFESGNFDAPTLEELVDWSKAGKVTVNE